MSKPGRNQPCPCGSGKKYKQCCLVAERDSQPASVTNLNWPRMRKADERLAAVLLDYMLVDYGAEAVMEAWDEFTLWNEVPFEPAVCPDIDTVFMPWMLYCWEPEFREERPGYPDICIAEHFLKNQSGQISAYERRFLQAALGNSLRFFQIIEVNAGNGLLLRDLFLQTEVFVSDRSATETAYPGGVLFARVMTLDAVSIMAGCAPMIFPPKYGLELLDIRDEWVEQRGAITAEVLSDWELELRDIYGGMQQELLNPTPPELQNTDGQAFQLTDLRYAIDCTPMEALEAMKTLALVKNVSELTRDAEFDADGGLRRVEFAWLRKESGSGSPMQNTVMAHISLEPGAMVIHVNSKERADQIQRKVQRRLGRKCRLEDIVVKPLDEISRAEVAPMGSEEAPGVPDDLAQSPEIQELMRHAAEQHWAQWLDTSIPALHGETPRQAVASAQGRERLELLLCDLASHPAEGNSFAPDVDAIRKELGLS